MNPKDKDEPREPNTSSVREPNTRKDEREPNTLGMADKDGEREPNTKN